MPPVLSVQLTPVMGKLLVLQICPEISMAPPALVALVHDLVTVSPGGVVQVALAVAVAVSGAAPFVLTPLAVTVSVELQVVGT